MVHVYQGVLEETEIARLLEYHSVDDSVTDARPDVRSKHPQWENEAWPRRVLEKALSTTLGDGYAVEEVVFTTTRIAFQLHADSGNGSASRSGKAVLLPLSVTGEGSTVFFDNYWEGPATKFTQEEFSPFSYWLPGKDGTWVKVKDIRALRETCLVDPDSVREFNVDPGFLRELDYLIEARSNGKLSKVEPREKNYCKIRGYRPGETLDQKIRLRYLPHLSPKTLEGLSLDRVVPWIPGAAIVFDRNQLHAGAIGHKEKTSVVIFTRKEP